MAVVVVVVRVGLLTLEGDGVWRRGVEGRLDEEEEEEKKLNLDPNMGLRPQLV